MTPSTAAAAMIVKINPKSATCNHQGGPDRDTSAGS